MLTIILAILPVVLVTSCGYLFKLSDFLNDDFWYGADKLAYYVLLPSLFVRLTATAELDRTFLGAPITLVITITTLTVLMLLSRRFISSSPPAFTSMYQGAVRFNSFVLLAVSLQLYGDAVGAVTAVCIAVVVPLVNLTSVAILSRYGKSHSAPSWRKLLMRLATNPLIDACVIGLLINVTQLPVPTSILSSLEILGQAALPLGLLCVGAGIDVRLLGSWQPDIVITNVIKLIIKPLLVMGLGTLLGLEGLTFAATVLFAAMPTATSAYILARQLGGDDRLMATIVMSQTIFSALTVPMMLFVFNRFVSGG
jgi:predicted permease